MKTQREIGRSLFEQGWTNAQVAALLRQRNYKAGDAVELCLGYEDARIASQAETQR